MKIPLRISKQNKKLWEDALRLKLDKPKAHITTLIHLAIKDCLQNTVPNIHETIHGGDCVHPRGYIKSERICGLCGKQPS